MYRLFFSCKDVDINKFIENPGLYYAIERYLDDIN
jgi:hypothetical protein